MASAKSLRFYILVTLVSLIFLSDNTEGHHGPMLIFKMGKRHHKGGGGGGHLATLLAAGAVAHLLQHKGGGGGGHEHKVEPIYVPVPVHHGHGYGGGWW